IVGEGPKFCKEVGKIEHKGKLYGCYSYREGCTFTLPKRFVGKANSETNLKKLLEGQKTNLIKGFKSKKGKTFDAYLRYDTSEQKLTFEFPNMVDPIVKTQIL